MAQPIRRSDVAALNRALSDEGYFGGVEQPAAPSSDGRRHARPSPPPQELRALAEKERPSVQLDALLAFLDAHDRIPADWRSAARAAPARATGGAVGDSWSAPGASVPGRFAGRAAEVAAMIRRWIEGQTFAPRAGAAGVQLLDAQAARYGEFDEVFLVGLVEGEWPQRSTKSIFYPASLLSQLDWPDSRTALAGERAAFPGPDGAGAAPGASLDVRARERLHHRTRACFSRMPIGLGSALLVPPARAHSRMFVYEALASDPVEPSAVEGEASAWLAVRTARSEAAADRFHGAAASYKPAAYSVSSLERYLQCPFQFFAERVLEPRGRSRRRSHAESERARHLRARGLPEILRGVEPPGTSAALRRTTCRRRARFSARSSSRCSRSCPRTKRPCSARGFSVRPPTKGWPKRCFRSKPNGRRRCVERLLEHSLNGEFEIQDRDRDHGASRCAAKPIASTCCRTIRSASSTTS